MKLIRTVGLLLFLFGCTKKDQVAAETKGKTVEKNAAVEFQTALSPVPAKSSIFSKEMREAIYFSNSLEREALKLILKNNSLQKLTLFSVLSYIVETNAGVKKKHPDWS